MKISENIPETWESMMDDAIFIKNGVYSINQDIIDRSTVNTVGFYNHILTSWDDSYNYLYQYVQFYHT